MDCAPLLVMSIIRDFTPFLLFLSRSVYIVCYVLIIFQPTNLRGGRVRFALDSHFDVVQWQYKHVTPLHLITCLFFWFTLFFWLSSHAPQALIGTCPFWKAISFLIILLPCVCLNDSIFCPRCWCEQRGSVLSDECRLRNLLRIKFIF